MIWNETAVVCLYIVFRQTPWKTEKMSVVRQMFTQWISYIEGREISRIRIDVHQILLPEHSKRQLRRAHVFTPYIPNITFNTILLVTFKSSKWSYPLSVFFFFDENSDMSRSSSPFRSEHSDKLDEEKIWTWSLHNILYLCIDLFIYLFTFKLC